MNLLTGTKVNSDGNEFLYNEEFTQPTVESLAAKSGAKPTAAVTG
jgi:hypothetical protein